MKETGKVCKITFCASYLSYIGNFEKDPKCIAEDFEAGIPTIFSLKLNILERHKSAADYILRDKFGATVDPEDGSYNFNSRSRMFEALSWIGEWVF